MKVKTTYNKCNYITAGKEYEMSVCGTHQTITDDEGGNIDIMAPPYNMACAHLDGVGLWELVEGDGE